MLEDYKSKILGLSGEVLSDIAPKIRGWEGQASKIYFETLNLYPREISIHCTLTASGN